MYRTGDRARSQTDGAIEFLGRIDHQLKIRGFRVEPEEIESELNKHSSVLVSLVVALEDGSGGKRLAAYFVSEGETPPSTSELRQFLQTKLPDFMVPSVFVPMESLPVSPNGKLDRRALPLPESFAPALDTEFVAPRNQLEQELVTVWAEVLNVRRVGVNDNFFELGGHSLLAAKLLVRLREETECEVSMRTLFESPTVAQLAAAISDCDDSPTQSSDYRATPQLIPDRNHWHEPFPLADMQQAYWIGRSEEFELGGVATHLYVEVEVGKVSIERVEAVIQKLVQRHGMLRAIILPDGRQQVLENVAPYTVRVRDLRGLDQAASNAELEAVRDEMARQVCPADQWPWFEVRASLSDEARTRFHISYDLLIGDLASLQILIREFIHLFRKPEEQLSELVITFRDYVEAEAALQDSDLFRRAQAYWQERLKTMPPPPDLPLAKYPGSISSPHFVRRSAKLEAEKWQKLKARAARYNLTPTAIVLTAYVEVLAAWSASPRFTVNLPIQNRPAVHPQINDVVGEFTSLSLLSVDCSSPACFVERAQAIQKQLWDDLSHRQYSGTRVMRELAHAQGRASSAVMPVVFTSALNLEMSGWITGAAAEVVHTTLQTPQVWLDHQVGEHEGVLNFNWDAVDGLFPDRMFDDMFESFCNRLQQLAESDESWLEAEGITLPAAQLEQRSRINNTAVPLELTLLHTPFVEEARQNPQRFAIMSSSRSLTYGELDHCANVIAGILKKQQVPRGKLVAVVMEKGWEQVAGVLGILMAGVAYVPIDPQLPEARRLSLLADAEVDVVLTQPWLAKTLSWCSEFS
jgi:acyl carrier protein